jgi:hypothetical protein
MVLDVTAGGLVSLGFGTLIGGRVGASDTGGIEVAGTVPVAGRSVSAGTLGGCAVVAVGAVDDDVGFAVVTAVVGAALLVAGDSVVVDTGIVVDGSAVVIGTDVVVGADVDGVVVGSRVALAGGSIVGAVVGADVADGCGVG